MPVRRVRMTLGRAGVVRMLVRMSILIVRMIMSRPTLMLLRCDHVHLGPSDSAAHHLARLKPRAHVQIRGRLFKKTERDAGIHQRAQQHVAADPGKTL